MLAGKYVGMQECWHAGMYVGMQERWHAGVQAYKHLLICVSVFKSIKM